MLLLLTYSLILLLFLSSSGVVWHVAASSYPVLRLLASPCVLAYSCCFLFIVYCCFLLPLAASCFLSVSGRPKAVGLSFKRHIYRQGPSAPWRVWSRGVSKETSLPLECWCSARCKEGATAEHQAALALGPGDEPELRGRSEDSASRRERLRCLTHSVEESELGKAFDGKSTKLQGSRWNICHLEESWANHCAFEVRGEARCGLLGCRHRVGECKSCPCPGFSASGGEGRKTCSHSCRTLESRRGGQCCGRPRASVSGAVHRRSCGGLFPLHSSSSPSRSALVAHLFVPRLLVRPRRSELCPGAGRCVQRARVPWSLHGHVGDTGAWGCVSVNSLR